MIMDKKKRETQKKMKIDFKNSFFYLHAFLLEDFLSVSCHRIAEQLLYIHISLRPLQYIMYSKLHLYTKVLKMYFFDLHCGRN